MHRTRPIHPFAAALAALSVVCVAGAEESVRRDPSAVAPRVLPVGQGDGRGRVAAGPDIATWDVQAPAAGKLYGLDAGQTGRLQRLIGERMLGLWKLRGETQRLEHAAETMRAAGVTFDEDGLRSRFAAARSAITEYRLATRAEFRDKILTDDQRQLFDVIAADGTDPLTGNPVDPELPGHDPARFKAYLEAREKENREQTEAMQTARRTSAMFTGKGFVETEWSRWLEATARSVGMTAEQRTRADRLLNLAAEAAAEHRRAREADYRRIAADLAKLQQGRGDPATRVGVTKAAAELSAPVDAIGKRFRADVAALLDDAQSKKLPKW